MVVNRVKSTLTEEGRGAEAEHRGMPRKKMFAGRSGRCSGEAKKSKAPSHVGKRKRSEVSIKEFGRRMGGFKQPTEVESGSPLKG